MNNEKQPRKLNYLLVMPRLIQHSGDGYSFPLGIAYVSASMKKAGFNTHTINLNHREGGIADIIAAEIKAKQIDVIATGGLSFQYSTIRTVIEAAKQVSPEIIAIVGGGIITGDPAAAMAALAFADYGVIGEGEITICELCYALENSSDLDAVNGIIYRSHDTYKITSPRKEIEDINTIPWPDYEGFEIGQYLASSSPGISGLNQKNTVFMLASRSCPYNCTFCFHTIGRKYRQRSIDSFFAELDYLTSRYKIEFVCLADELFARDINRVREFCDRIVKYNIHWWAQFRVDDITVELLEILKKGGCAIMSFGLESADNRILKSMRKATKVEQIERTLKMVYDMGISLEGAFIFGDIEETEETANNTLKWWRDHAEYKISLNLITVYPGSYLYKYACENGIITDKVKFLKDGCPQINVSKLNDKQLSELIRKIMEAPISLTKTLTAVKLNNVDSNTGRIDIDGACITCGHHNRWQNIKLFATNFIPCQQCGQKYNIPLPQELRTNIDNNIQKLLAKYGKIAIWGINFLSSDLFKNSTILQNDNIFPVDISGSKQKMDLYGKKILSPEVIRQKNIEVVIVAIPVYLTQIKSQIENDYNDVKVIIDICRLTDKEYVI